MSDWRKMFPSEWLGSWDLEGKEVEVTIQDVGVEEIVVDKGRKEEKVVITFKGAKKRMIANKTNCRAIAAKHGNDVSGWLGKKVRLHTEEVEAFGGVHEAIRVMK